MSRLSAIDVFAGAGGATAGLVLAGCDVRLAIESDEDAVATYRANFPSVPVVAKRIEEYTPSGILREAGVQRGELAILAACPPCQGFSSLGKGDRDDERNDYVKTVGELVDCLRPKAVLLENVPGVIGDGRYAELKALLSALGYGLGEWILDAADFCVPQRRKRLVMFAPRGLPDSAIRDPRLAYACAAWGSHPHTVRDVLRLVGPLNPQDRLHDGRKLPPNILARVRAIPRDGGSRRDLPPNLQLECHKRLKASGAGSVYGRMAWDQPAPTITTRCTTPACGRFLHPEEDRPITLREAAAFQTFSLGYRWRGGVQSIARQIGNAVPARLVHLLVEHARKLIELAEGRRQSVAPLAVDSSLRQSPRSEVLATPSS